MPIKKKGSILSRLDETEAQRLARKERRELNAENKPVYIPTEKRNQSGGATGPAGSKPAV